MSAAAGRRFDVAIIGAGCSGIGAAVRLRQAGFGDLVVLEKAGEVGGTWRENTYPGCACDVPSALYSYSFAPNPDWSRAFAGQEEIWRYLRRVADEHGVRPAIRFGAEVLDARWDEDTRVWRLATRAGAFVARALVAAAGPLHEPSIPALPGLSDFGGRVFHSSRWDHGHDLRGRRVAVVGTGASAVQFVPEIQPRVAALHVFQRTPSWVLPKPNPALSEVARAVFRRVPSTQRAVRAAQDALLEGLAVGFRHPRAMGVLEAVARRHLRRQIPDPALRQALTPRFVLGCKRILLSSTYYPALAQPNVRVHATAVARVAPGRVIGADGSEAAVDTIVFGTGFHVTDPPIAARIRGVGGELLSARWAGSPRGYLGTTMVGYPNLFFMLGPNLGTGHSSAFAILEAQLAQIAAALSAMRERGWTRLAVRPEAEAAYNDALQAGLARTVYNAGGCRSYYLDTNGRNSTTWPWSTARLVRTVGRFEPGAYDAR